MNDFEYKYQKLSRLLKLIGFKILSDSDNYFSYEYENYIFHINIDLETSSSEFIDSFHLNTYISADEYIKNREKYVWVKILSLFYKDEQEYYELSYFEEDKIINENTKEDAEKLIIKYLKKIFFKELIKNIINDLGK